MDNVSIFLAKLKQCVDVFDEIDDLIDENRNKMSKVDSELSDWIHKLQCDDSLTPEQMASIAYKIKDLRKERATLCNESQLMVMFRGSGRDLFFRNSRKGFVEEVKHTVSNFNAPYNNRVITKEDVESVISKQDDCEPIQRKPRNDQVNKEEVVAQLKLGVRAVEVAKRFDLAVSTVYKIKKEVLS